MKRALRSALRSLSSTALCGARKSAPRVPEFARLNPAASRSARDGNQLRVSCSHQHSHSCSSAAHQCLLLEEGCSSSQHFWVPAAWSSQNREGGERERSFALLRAAAAAATAAAAAVAAAVAVDSAGGRAAKCDYAEGTKFTDVYYLADNAPALGVGSFGTVCTAQHKSTGNVVAVKRIPRTNSPNLSFAEIAWEVEVLKVAGEHRNVTQFHDVFEDDDYYYLTMELARGGELFDLLVESGPPDEANTAALMKALVEAVAFVHLHGIIHGDIKPENVFLTNSSTGDVDWEGVRLGDFGSAVEVALAGKTTLSGLQTRGTVAYNPPESMQRMLEREDVVVSPMGDVWALGVVLFMLLTGEHPFAPDMSITDEEMAECVLRAGDGVDGESRLFVDEEEEGEGAEGGGARSSVPPLARDLILRMLRKDPAERATTEEILQHPWLRSAASRGAALGRAQTRPDGAGRRHRHRHDRHGRYGAVVPTSQEELQKFWSARRRLKACMLALMTGLVDGVFPDLFEEERFRRAVELAAVEREAMKAKLPPQSSAPKSSKHSLPTVDQESGTIEGQELAIEEKKREEAAAAAAAAAAEAASRMDIFLPFLTDQSIGPPPHPIGSREAACGMIDRGGKGYITAGDLEHMTRVMGEKFTRAEIREMMRAIDGDPATESRRVTYGQMVRTVAPLCPAKEVAAGQTLYGELDLDPTFYLLKKGVVEFSIASMHGEADLQHQLPGASFGEVELLRADECTTPRLATCKCLGQPDGGGCEVLVVTEHMFDLLTDTYQGVRTTLGRQREVRLKQLSVAVLRKAFEGEEASLKEPGVIWGGGVKEAEEAEAKRREVEKKEAEKGEGHGEEEGTEKHAAGVWYKVGPLRGPFSSRSTSAYPPPSLVSWTAGNPASASPPVPPDLDRGEASPAPAAVAGGADSDRSSSSSLPPARGATGGGEGGDGSGGGDGDGDDTLDSSAAVATVGGAGTGAVRQRKTRGGVSVGEEGGGEGEEAGEGEGEGGEEGGEGGGKEGSFVVLVLEGSVTAEYDGVETTAKRFDGDPRKRPRKATRYDRVVERGEFLFCGEGFGVGAPVSPTVVSLKPGQKAKLLRIRASDFAPMMGRKHMASLKEFMFKK